MRLRRAAIGSALFFLAAPGIVVGLVPWWITRWELRPAPLAIRVLGAAVLSVAVPVLVSAFVRFVADGLGTPAPVAPTERLVVSGAYRHVRNPMYVAVIGAIVGQALLLGQLALLGYAALVASMVVSFVRLHEEPVLRRRFGEQYEAYRRAVPGWFPRLRPWSSPPHR
jgi:protein-S-isoprenylcysteine O-methyltransferase Ste14